MSGDTGDDLDDLINFLADKRAQVKLMALDIIKGLTGSPEGIEKLKSKLEKLLVFLLRLVPVPDPEPDAVKISEEALGIMVNLSQDTASCGKMHTMRVIARIMDYIREGACPHNRLMVMLLCNMTVTERGCQDLLQFGQERVEGLNIAILLKKFVFSGIDWVPGRPDPYEHVAAILTNVTRLAKARELLLQPGRGLLPVLVAQLKSPSEMRRRGATGAIKNCCMQAEEDKNLDAILADETVLAKMMEPINGEEPKEKDATVRQALAEAVLALASTTAGRAALWKIKAPEILKKGYEEEEDPGVCLAMERAAEQFLFNGRVEDADADAEQTPEVDSKPAAAATAAETSHADN